MCRAKPSMKSYWLRLRLVGDHHDVVALGKRRMPVALVLWEELVDGGEDHTARGDLQELPQVRAALGLHRRLAQEILTAREGAEELLIEVVAVGEHDDGRVLHRRLADDASGVKGHRQALARALRMPDHPYPPVTRLATGLPAGLVASLASATRSASRRSSAARSVSLTATRTAWNWW